MDNWREWAYGLAFVLAIVLVAAKFFHWSHERGLWVESWRLSKATFKEWIAAELGISLAGGVVAWFTNKPDERLMLAVGVPLASLGLWMLILLVWNRATLPAIQAALLRSQIATARDAQTEAAYRRRVKNMIGHWIVCAKASKVRHSPPAKHGHQHAVKTELWQLCMAVFGDAEASPFFEMGAEIPDRMIDDAKKLIDKADTCHMRFDVDLTRFETWEYLFPQGHPIKPDLSR